MHSYWFKQTLQGEKVALKVRKGFLVTKTLTVQKTHKRSGASTFLKADKRGTDAEMYMMTNEDVRLRYDVEHAARFEDDTFPKHSGFIFMHWLK